MYRLPRPRARARAVSTAAATPSVNPAEIAHFSRLASQWWDERGEFGLLHKMNPVRVQFIREKLLEAARDDQHDQRDAGSDAGSAALAGRDVLDVGCGGGLLSESLARLGGNTLGIDASPENIAIATLHASHDPRLSPGASPSPRHALHYRHCAAEDLVAEHRHFDVVCSLEVVEHVDNPAAFLTACADLVKPGGHLFLSTIARTPLSYLLTILAAEHLLRLVEPGTHSHAKYINPHELTAFFHERGWLSHPHPTPIRTEGDVRGVLFLPWKAQWVLAPRGAWGSTECNYLFWARKPRHAVSSRDTSLCS